MFAQTPGASRQNYVPITQRPGFQNMSRSFTSVPMGGGGFQKIETTPGANSPELMGQLQQHVASGAETWQGGAIPQGTNNPAIPQTPGMFNAPKYQIPYGQFQQPQQPMPQMQQFQQSMPYQIPQSNFQMPMSFQSMFGVPSYYQQPQQQQMPYGFGMGGFGGGGF
jgi:hypothetical protein